MATEQSAAHSGMLSRQFTDRIEPTLRGYLATVYRPDGSVLAEASFPVRAGRHPVNGGWLSMSEYDAACTRSYQMAKEWLSLWELEPRN